MNLKKINYASLNSRQQENYNYHKIAAVLADYGFSTILLNDDWQGADFIANHVDGETFLKVQLKGRVTINKKYVGKNIYIAFRSNDKTYLYPHDEMMEKIFKALPNTKARESWTVSGGFSWPKPTKTLLKLLKNYEL